jgi:hypothetical protein
MIRQMLLASVTALVFATGAHAQCSCATTQVTNGLNSTDQNLSSALSRNTVCVAKGGGWENQEYHAGSAAGGNIIDYKKGPTDPVDPTATIGTWAISGNGRNTQVTYSYSGGSIGVYAVCGVGTSTPGPGSAIGFCSAATSPATISATIKGGQGPCP